MLLFSCYGDHRDLHVLTHSGPTRRSADLAGHSTSASRSRSTMVFAIRDLPSLDIPPEMLELLHKIAIRPACNTHNFLSALINAPALMNRATPPSRATTKAFAAPFDFHNLSAERRVGNGVAGTVSTEVAPST